MSFPPGSNERICICGLIFFKSWIWISVLKKFSLLLRLSGEKRIQSWRNRIFGSEPKRIGERIAEQWKRGWSLPSPAPRRSEDDDPSRACRARLAISRPVGRGAMNHVRGGWRSTAPDRRSLPWAGMRPPREAYDAATDYRGRARPSFGRRSRPSSS